MERSSLILGPELLVENSHPAHPLQRLIDAVDCVSFDIFDTAILRKVERPIDVFELVARDYRHAHPNASAFDFARAREHAEREARGLAWAARRAPEIGFDDIYRSLQTPPDWDRAELAAIERRVEREVCVRNPYVHEAYRYALARGKKIVFASDMYLPAELLESILREQGYAAHAGLYLSSALDATKWSGELYRLLLESIGVAPDKVLHIGDNYHSDVLMARTRGLLAHHYRRCATYAPAWPPVREPAISVHRALSNNYYYSNRDPSRTRDFWYALGYECAGILYLGFAQWLHRQFARDGIERVYFLARDGWIMKQVYARLPNALPAHYLYASRRSLNVPSIETLDDKAIDFLVSGSSVLRIADFIERLGLNARDYEDAIARAGFRDSSQLVKTPEDYQRLRGFYRSIASDLMEVARRERSHLLDYLKDSGMLDARRAAIVDLGWHGTLQNSLAKLIRTSQSDVKLFGYYLGTFPPAREYSDRGLSLNAFLCNHGEPSEYERLIKTCVEVFEFFHLAPHGSVMRFQRGEAGLEPVMAAHDADASVLDQAQRVQRGGLQFVDDFLPLAAARPWLAISREVATAPIARVLLHPSRLEAQRLGDLTHAEGFGQVFLKRHLARPPALGQALRAPRRILHGYDTAFWQEGYKTRLFGRNRWLRRIGELALYRLPRGAR